MSTRLVSVVASALVLVAVAACAGATGDTPSATAPSGVAHGPVPTTVPAPAGPGDPVHGPNAGGVDGDGRGPELTIEALDEDTIQATLLDPAAKAWRLVIAGTGDRGGDRWEIAVETGDVAPVITATEVREGEVVGTLDLGGFVDGTAAAGGCHGTLPVCLGSDGVRVPADGDGVFSVRLDLPEAPVPLVVRGATAAWDGEPFILGEWQETEAFPWGED